MGTSQVESIFSRVKRYCPIQPETPQHAAPPIVRQAPFTRSDIVFFPPQNPLHSPVQIRYHDGAGTAQNLRRLVAAALQNTTDTQCLGHLKIVGGIPDHHSPPGIEPSLCQILKSQGHLAFGVDVTQPQQSVKIGGNPSHRHLMFQGGDGRIT